MNVSDIIALGAAGVAVASICISFWVSRRQIEQERVSIGLTLSSSLFAQWRSPEMVRARIYVIRELPAASSGTDGYKTIPDEHRWNVIQLSHLCDEIGALVLHKHLDLSLVASYIGESILDLWKKLGPYIWQEAHSRSGGEYQVFFEALVRKLEAANPREVRAQVLGTHVDL